MRWGYSTPMGNSPHPTYLIESVGVRANSEKEDSELFPTQGWHENCVIGLWEGFGLAWGLDL